MLRGQNVVPATEMFCKKTGMLHEENCPRNMSPIWNYIYTNLQLQKFAQSENGENVGLQLNVYCQSNLGENNDPSRKIFAWRTKHSRAWQLAYVAWRFLSNLSSEAARRLGQRQLVPFSFVARFLSFTVLCARARIAQKILSSHVTCYTTGRPLYVFVFRKRIYEG